MINLVIGLFIGTFIGFVYGGSCRVAKDYDEKGDCEHAIKK